MSKTLTSDLFQRCRELLELKEKGQHEQHALRALADAYDHEIPYHVRRSMAESQTHIEAMRALLATQQPEPRDEVADTARTARRHWNPVYNTDPVQRACTELPEGWSISACMEREAGWVDVYGPDGKEPNFEGDSDHFDWLIHQAIDFAIDAARAGGQHADQA